MTGMCLPLLAGIKPPGIVWCQRISARINTTMMAMALMRVNHNHRDTLR